MNLEEQLTELNNSNVVSTDYKADMEITISSDTPNEGVIASTDEVSLTDYKTSVIGLLGKYDELQKDSAKVEVQLDYLKQQLEDMYQTVRDTHKDLIDQISQLENQIATNTDTQNSIVEELLPMQRNLFKANAEDKTFVVNKIQATYVAPTEKNTFDLKKFKEEKKDFWTTNASVLMPYAKITPVADYVKITIKKK